jgi:hypothetical protein
MTLRRIFIRLRRPFRYASKIVSKHNLSVFVVIKIEIEGISKPLKIPASAKSEGALVVGRNILLEKRNLL